MEKHRKRLLNARSRQPAITDAPINDLDAQEERDRQIMNQPLLRPVNASPLPIHSCQGWSLESLLSQSNNFEPVPRVSWSPTETTEAQIRRHERANPGVPLVVDGLHRHPKWMKEKFTPAWFERNGPQEISVRNVHDRFDKTVGISDFLAYAQDAAHFATPGETERLYGKDVPCPDEWNKFLHNEQVIPAYLAPDSPENLLNALPPSDRIETLMCYLGIGDTFTPCHKDLCASSGHNLMVFTQGGSSFWFMTATSSAHAAAEYFSKKLGHELDHENHVVTIKEFAKAPFKVYIAEQKLGDLILVPPRSCHQVVNAGGLTIKTSWVCRLETYRVKCTIYNVLLQTTKAVSDLLSKQAGNNAGGKQDMPTHLSKLRRLIDLFDTILVEEHSSTCGKMTVVPLSPGEEDAPHLTCDFCGSDIFQSFFECRSCVEGERAAPGSGLAICPGCYVEGRTCRCEVMVPMQRRSIDELLQRRGHAVDLFKACSGLQPKKTQFSIPPSNDELLKGGEKIGIFRAAIHLRRIRKNTKAKESKRCTSFSKNQHDTQFSWALTCKQCHHSSCFAHLVTERHFHSAEALLAHRKDEQNQVFHQSHKTSQKKFTSEASALSAEDPDRAPNLGAQLAYLADTFTTCRPIGYSKYRKAGFYDLTVWENEVRGGPFLRVNQASLAPSSLLSTTLNPLWRPQRYGRMDAKAASISKTSTLAEPAVPSKPKRLVMDYIEVPIYRPPKRKEIPVESTEIESQPPRKKLKQTHPKGPPGVRNLSATKASRPAKKDVINISDDSDSEERPLKRPRPAPPGPTPQVVKDLRFKKTKQTAVSVADAFNNASAQNAISVPSGSSARPSPIPPPPPPRRSVKRRARPEVTPPSSSSSSSPDGRLDDNAVAAATLEEAREFGRRQQESIDERRRDFSQGSSSLAPPPAPSRRVERRASSSQDVMSGSTLVDELQRELREVKEIQAQQKAEINRLRQANANAQLLNPSSDSVNTLVGIVSSLVSTLPAFHPAPSTSEQKSRNWSTGYRNMRGRSASFGESSRRVYPPAGHHYGSSRGRQYYESSSGSYGRYTTDKDRTWQQGPYANDGYDRRGQASFDFRPRHRTDQHHMDHEPETPPAAHQGNNRRQHTRFSPPSSENRLALVPCRPGSRLEGQDSGSEGTTVTNPDASAATNPMHFTPARPKKSLFGTLTSDAPPDEQDWEARYANEDS
ncbi:hypothetical protein FB45DRAFT_1026885 [Roridomyces roridus]|uniref:JmjC domain-containing protein n=1 Tax=Roridomyces roridus TaxID=1738132 RepID=A0AAD7FQ23_9AGAR|nr:hypothetical protein FB45DRAFT_1026885 [Roridomyces roridus]